MGGTLNPGRRGLCSLARFTTKPDWPSRVSTLQVAHCPVRGHLEGAAEPVAVVLAAVPIVGALSALDVPAPESGGSAPWGEDRPQAIRSARASKTGPGRFFIESQR